MLKSTISALALAAAFASAATADTTYIHAGALIADAADAPRGASTVIVEDGTIRDILDGHVSPSAGAMLVDMSGATVMPGLIDAHVHLTGDHDTPFWQNFIDTDEYGVALGLKNARKTLDAGVTTVRDLGASPEAIYAIRRAIAEGHHMGPRVVAAGTAISIIGGHGDLSGVRAEIIGAVAGDNTCTGPEECSMRVREFSRAGADLIKITATGGVLSQQGRGLEAHFTDAEMEAIVDTARVLGLKVAAHAHGARGIESAVRAGVASIEHGTFIDEDGIEAMEERGTWYVPTLMAYRGIEEGLGTGLYTPVVEAKIRQTLASVGKGLAAAHNAGVPIAFGTDAGVFAHGRNNEEAVMMVERSGLDPRSVLISATTGAAELLGLSDTIGRLMPGMSADIIAVEGNPLTDINVMMNIRYVMAAGREHRLPE
ncbi:MAG: amidohydrolase family protein [Pacificimonas sp.]